MDNRLRVILASIFFTTTILPVLVVINKFACKIEYNNTLYAIAHHIILILSLFISTKTADKANENCKTIRNPSLYISFFFYWILSSSIFLIMDYGENIFIYNAVFFYLITFPMAFLMDIEKT